MNISIASSQHSMKNSKQHRKSGRSSGLKNSKSSFKDDFFLDVEGDIQNKDIEIEEVGSLSKPLTKS